MVSYQAQSPVLGAVLPSNSPGVHTLWLPVIPLQMGLVLKPGPQEPWTPYRMIAAYIQAGIPAEVFCVYPGGAEAGAAVLEHCTRAMIFGGTATVERYKGNPRVQAHGPGFSKILLGDDEVDNWEKYLDLMVESIYINCGRGCINCSGIWASRHTKEIAQALAEKIGPIEAKPPTDPKAGLAAFTVPGQAKAVWGMIEADLKETGVTDMTAKYGPRLVEKERCDYLRPMIVHCTHARSGDRQEGIHVPLRDRRRMPAGPDARKDGPDARLHRHHQEREADPAAQRRHPHRPPQHRPHPHHQAQLAPAARRQHHRLPVPQPGVSGGLGNGRDRPPSPMLED